MLQINAVDEWQSLRQAAATAGVDRNTVARWVRQGLLKSRKGKVRHLQTTLVEVAKVRELAKQRKPGRPRKNK
jgi:predicted site-specific integrase-resolvase